MLPSTTFDNISWGMEIWLKFMGQELAKVPGQWVEIDIFYGCTNRVIPVITSAPQGLACVNPVCCLVTGAMKTISLNKGFKQIDRMTISIYPVGSDTFDDAS